MAEHKTALSRGAVGGLAAVIAILLAGVAGAEDEAAMRKKLSGTWSGFVVHGRGERPNQGPARITEMVISPDLITARDGARDFGAGTYRLDPAKGFIDSTGTRGEPRGKTFLGIYTLEGDTLKWCSANPGKARPTELMTRPGSGHFLMILTRKK